MTSRDIVRRTLDYEHPERVARSFGDSDFCSAHPRVKTFDTEWKQLPDGSWERTDGWGNLLRRVDATSIGEIARGILEGLASFDDYQFPDYSRPEAYQPVAECRRKQPEKWLLGGLPGFTFSITRKLCRLERYLVDLLLERDRMHALHDRVDALLADMIRNYGATGADGVFFCEDWGTQQQTLVSPQTWREEFFPRTRALCGLAHELGLRIFMHSCGQTEAIVPGLMEAGIDVLQFDQPDLHGVDTLAAHQERGRITFWCPVDIQTTLQTRNEAAIRRKAREMLDKLWRGRGGFIAGYYGDNPSIGLDPVWQEHASDEFLKHGVRDRYAGREPRTARKGDACAAV